MKHPDCTDLRCHWGKVSVNEGEGLALCPVCARLYKKDRTARAARMTIENNLSGIEFANSGHRDVAVRRLTEMLLSFVERIDELEAVLDR